MLVQVFTECPERSRVICYELKEKYNQPWSREPDISSELRVTEGQLEAEILKCRRVLFS